MDEDIPQWAKERAADLADAVMNTGPGIKWKHLEHYACGQAFARYIAEHEEPPVDPLLEACRKVGIGRGVADDLRTQLAFQGLEVRAMFGQSK